MIWLALLKTNVMKLSAYEMYVSTLRMYIYQHQLCLFVVHFQVSVILAQRHNKLTALEIFMHFKARVNKKTGMSMSEVL